MNSEQKRFTEYKKLKTFVYPESYNIGERREFKKKDGKMQLIHVPVNAQFIPIRHVLKLFFELPNVHDDTINYINELKAKATIISNIIQGNYWKIRSENFGDKIVFPIILYYDDYENNNPLGSHKGLAKTGAVYISIPVLAPQYQAKLENIFLFILFNTLDRECFKNKIIFTKAIEELNFLADFGIDIELPSGNTKIFFEVALFVGDNLGVHTMLGLSESFKCNVFCQHCLITQYEKNKVFQEQECILRTFDNYDHLVKENNFKSTGIKEPCILHQLKNFHSATNIAVDVMHDLFEGICRYDVALILKHFIYTMKLFTLEEFNSRLQSFDYGPNYNVNKPPQFSEKSIKNGYVVMSSSEMFCLMLNLNLIIGELIPLKDEYWDLFLNLQEIILIVTSPNVHSSTPEYLKTIVYEYLSSLSLLFPNSLKPKHHFLVHYPRIMLQFGPLLKLSCFRFEGKNQEGKQISKSTTSRININRSICIKNQLYLHNRFLKRETCPIFKVKSYKKYKFLR